MEKICVVGLGYIGLPTAMLFAEQGFEVNGVDINKEIVEQLNSAKLHINEPGLEDVFNNVNKKGLFKASMQPEKSDVFIIAVPTPKNDDLSANVDYVKSAVQNILPVLKKGDLVLVESTIPPRTIEDVVAPILTEEGYDVYNNDVFLTHCPERVIPGKIMVELKENNRIVGGLTEEAAVKAAELYSKVTTGGIFKTDSITAETSKLMENTYRDVNIALANELVKVAEKINVNSHDVIELANMHPRVNIHQPGPGVGGHCIAVDPYFIIEKALDETPLIQTARKINNSMPEFVVKQVEKHVNDNKKSKIAVLGLTYKGNVGDVRESPALTIVNLLQQKLPNVEIACNDNLVNQEHVNYTLQNIDETLDGADLALVLADHDYYKEVTDSQWLKMNKNTVIDTKNCINPMDSIELIKIGDFSKK